jgi:hypothetical protein
MRGHERDTSWRYSFPVEMFLSRGFAVVTCCYAQISPDVEVREGDPPDLAWTGIFDLWGPHDPARGDNPTALGAWAWALSRGLDLAERIPEIDAARSVATGCSRLGKVALLAGARVWEMRLPLRSGLHLHWGTMKLIHNVQKRRGYQF